MGSPCSNQINRRMDKNSPFFIQPTTHLASRRSGYTEGKLKMIMQMRTSISLMIIGFFIKIKEQTSGSRNILVSCIYISSSKNYS
jgi:hypothetical protein